MIWFSSDFHFGHNKEFIYKPRGFDNMYDMANAIIKNCNEVICWDDNFYILGDCMLGDDSFGLSCLKQLPGKKHLVIGNHDSDNRIQLYVHSGIFYSIEWGGRLRNGKYSFYLSHYPMMMGNYKDRHPTWCLAGHTHSFVKFENGNNCVYNVAVDAHNCCPVSFDQIMSEITEYREEHPVIPFFNKI